ncbi:MAG: glycosyltransferase family 9 protein, partial [Candidatus Omnitrophica bacterium]|nr:glycosyltransferase family 9 protein [Candidatus Omnitrophota bacterium]
LLAHIGVSAEKPWIVFNPSASCPSKIWPAERFAELADQLQTRYGAECLVIGTSGDRVLVKRVIQAAKMPIRDLSGRLSIGMLGELLSRAKLLISNDSGPVHLANAVGLPVISIFGRKQAGLSPLRWGPLDPGSRVVWKDAGCETCAAHLCPIHFLCLDAIRVEDVWSHTLFFEKRLTGTRL